MSELGELAQEQLIAYMRRLQESTERIGMLEAEVDAYKGLLTTISMNMGIMVSMVETRLSDAKQLALPPGGD